jgi:preprotein translocase subunit SecF
MEFFRIRRDIPFMRHALVFNVISFATFALAVFFLVTRGLHLSIEFKGGTVLEVEYAQAADLEKTRKAIDTLGFGEVQIQNFGTSRDVLLRLPVRGDAKPGEQAETATQAFATLCTAEGGTVATKSYTTPQGEQVSRPSCTKADGSEPLKLSRTEFVGPAVGSELALDGAKALAFVVVGIMLYLAFRFEWKFAVAGIIANLHDVVIILGFFAFFQWEFSLAVLAAVLAVLGYSVNESVVIFDRDHPRLHPDHGAGHAAVRRPDPALLRGGADDRHPVRHLLVGVRGRGHRDVAGREA